MAERPGDAATPGATPAQRLSFGWLLYFLLSVVFVGCVGSCVFLPCRLAPEGSPVRRFGERWAAYFTGLILRIQPWLSLNVPAEEVQKLHSAVRSVPQHSGCLLIANHQSPLDIFLLLGLVPGLRTLAKSALLRIPFLGTMMILTGQIPVTRGKLDAFWKALEKVRIRLRAGDTVLIFPEMTRAAPGARQTLEFNIAPFLVALQERAPVVPVVITGSGQAWPKGLSGVAPGTCIALQILPALLPEQFDSAQALSDAARLQIDRALASAA
ncbi:MAG TPA: 1-acyl-sn-glycerol-3-phosphate acyltransferase [Polyangiaceae bacterium]|nr:1-acyl-sn-glycerol-3-phosphate acyltransferase [Polyangiaceae bacterium]